MEEDEDFENDEAPPRCFSRSVYKDCLDSSPSPPPPYEDPPSYNVAILMEQSDIDSVNDKL